MEVDEPQQAAGAAMEVSARGPRRRWEAAAACSGHPALGRSVPAPLIALGGRPCRRRRRRRRRRRYTRRCSSCYLLWLAALRRLMRTTSRRRRPPTRWLENTR